MSGFLFAQILLVVAAASMAGRAGSAAQRGETSNAGGALIVAFILNGIVIWLGYAAHG